VPLWQRAGAVEPLAASFQRRTKKKCVAQRFKEGTATRAMKRGENAVVGRNQAVKAASLQQQPSWRVAPTARQRNRPKSRRHATTRTAAKRAVRRHGNVTKQRPSRQHGASSEVREPPAANKPPLQRPAASTTNQRTRDGFGTGTADEPLVRNR